MSPAAARAAAFAPARRSARRALASSRRASAAARPASSASSPVARATAACLPSRACAVRERSFAAIACARLPAARLRSRTLVLVAPPEAWIRRPVAAIRRIALASSPEPAGQATFAGTTVVSARSREARSSFCLAALASSASFSPATAPSPHRVVSFISVAGCGTLASSGIRQNRRQETGSLTPAHRLS